MHACVRAKSPSCVRVSATPWSVACPAPLFMGFFMATGVGCHPSMGSSSPGVEPKSLTPLHWEADSLPLVPCGKPAGMGSSGQIPDHKIQRD